MSEQYFSREPSSQSNPVSFNYVYRGKTLSLRTDAGVFSRGEMDYGTRTLLDALPPLYGRVLDLGCGYGAVGVCAAAAYDVALTMTDVNLRALELARENLRANNVEGCVVESDGLSAVAGAFDFILLNPPIRAGKEVVYRLFSESARALNAGGALYLVIRKQQGAQSAEKYLNTLFASVETVERSGGFRVLKCQHEGEKTP